jgi:hypothetical protein
MRPGQRTVAQPRLIALESIANPLFPSASQTATAVAMFAT